MSALAFSVAKFCVAYTDVRDNDLILTLQTLAETFRTLDSGIYYEKPPDAKSARELYDALKASIEEIQRESNQQRFARPKNSDVFNILVVLHRMALLRSNGRSRSRRYIASLLDQFRDVPELKPQETSRIIVP
jgi:broad specificity phosphatase PhoE